MVADPPYGIGFMGHEWDQPGHVGRATLYDPPRLWCPVDGQGYRLAGTGPSPDIKITPPCNGGIHSDGYGGFR